MASIGSPGGPASVVVIGGGITGLAAAHRFVERAGQGGSPLSIVVLESDDRAGGQIRTERHGDFLFEGGPDALVAQKPAGVALCERLGLGPDLRELGGRKSGTQVFYRGRLHRVPDGFLMMAPTRLAPVLRSSLFSWRGKLRMACEPFVPRRSASCDDESLASFVSRRFGNEVLERVAEPVMASLFTADSDRLSLRMTMPRFLDLEAAEGSVTRGLRRAARAHASARPFGHGTGRGGFVAVSGGLSRIVEGLVARLPEGAVRTGAHVKSVEASRIGELAAALTRYTPDIQTAIQTGAAHAHNIWVTALFDNKKTAKFGKLIKVVKIGCFIFYLCWQFVASSRCPQVAGLATRRIKALPTPVRPSCGALQPVFA